MKRSKFFILFATLLGVCACGSPDPLQVALEQRTVSYVSGSDYTPPSTLR